MVKNVQVGWALDGEGGPYSARRWSWLVDSGAVGLAPQPMSSWR